MRFLLVVHYASRRDKVSRAFAANAARATVSKRTQAAIDSRAFSLLLPPIATSCRNYPLATLALVGIALGAEYGLDDNAVNLYMRNLLGWLETRLAQITLNYF